MDFPVDEFKKTDSIRKAKGIKITDIKRLQEIKEIERKKQIEEDKKKQDSIAKLAADEKAKLDSLKAIEAKKAALAKKRDELNKVNKTTDQEKKNKELAQQHQQENKGHIPEEKDLTIQEKLELQRIADEQKKHDLAKKAKTEEKKKSYLDKDQFKKDSMVTIKGKIVDSKTGKALQAHIEIYDGKGNVFFKTQAASDGAYSFKMPARMLTEYSMSVEIDGYMYKADKIKYDKTDDKNSLQTDVKLNKLETGLKTVLRNVYFELNSAKLNPESYAELNKLAALLVSNKNIKARIGGHTDNLGPESFNKALSMRRVYVVMDYLMKHGIDRDRLEGIGYGSSRPIASNDDEFEGRELNRRTEFEIIK
jgi:outer membrane protein OmpA-like peptidoglycan-associated protein